MKIFCLKLLIFCFLIISLICSVSTQVQASPIDNKCPEEMVFIPGGTFNIGSDTNYESEKSASDVTMDSFCIDRHEVTNAEFRQFVEATGYQTIAERPLSKEQFPTLSEEQRQLSCDPHCLR